MKLGIREIFILVLMLGFRRLQEQRAFYQRDIESKRETLVTLAASSATVMELESQLTDLGEAVSVFEKKLPKQKEVDQILSEVWKLGEKHALRAQSVKPLKVDRAGACSEQPIELAFEGDFPGFHGFLRELESSDRIVRVTKIDLRNVEQGKKPMQAKLTLNIYFEPDLKPVAQASAH